MDLIPPRPPCLSLPLRILENRNVIVLYQANNIIFKMSLQSPPSPTTINKIVCETLFQSSLNIQTNQLNDKEVQSGSLIMNTLGTKKAVHNRETAY